MPRKKPDIHYLYRITCKITGRYYIGLHSTSNLEDGYMGSGKRLRYSIRKYGKENHIKEILEFFDCREALVEAEKRAITKDMLIDVNCMNLMSGGTGGLFNLDHVIEAGKIAGAKQKARILTDSAYREKVASNFRKIVIEAHKTGKYNHQHLPRKKHSDETKQKMSESSKGMGVGKENSQYGTMWITNGNENRKVKKEDVIPDDWEKGRTKK